MYCVDCFSYSALWLSACWLLARARVAWSLDHGACRGRVLRGSRPCGGACFVSADRTWRMALPAPVFFVYLTSIAYCISLQRFPNDFFSCSPHIVESTSCASTCGDRRTSSSGSGSSLESPDQHEIYVQYMHICQNASVQFLRR